MVKLDVEHILILLIAIFIIYHLSSCRCFNNGFRVGGASDNTCDILVKGCKGRKCVDRNLRNCDAPGVDLTGRDLIGADLENASLTGANLMNTNLPHTNFSGANLTRANLTDAYLFDANLTDANLTNASLTNADLTYANLSGADLYGADLTGANLAGIINALDAKCSTGEKGTIFPENSPYMCSSNDLWKYKNCSNALETICPIDIHTTRPICSSCTGEHQRPLRVAGCSGNDVANYCNIIPDMNFA